MTTVAIEFPTEREESIRACKREIRYRADYMCLDYDPADIEHFEAWGGHTIVLLANTWREMLVERPPDAQDEDPVETARIKTPTVWLTWHNASLTERPPPFVIPASAPLIHARFPQLIAIIDSSGHVRMEGRTTVGMLQAWADVDAMRVFERVAHDCFEYKVERLITKGIERERENDCYS